MRHIPLNDDLKLEKDMADRNSPTLLDPRTGAPMTVVVGGDESEEFRRQSTDFAESWRQRRVRIEYVEMSGLNHFTVVDQLKDPANPLTEKMLLHMGLV
jgi:arylformamidase